MHLPVQIHIVKVEGFRASQAFGNFCLLDRFFAFVTGVVPALFGVLFLQLSKAEGYFALNDARGGALAVRALIGGQEA